MPLEPSEAQVWEFERLSRIHRSDPRVPLLWAYVSDLVLEEAAKAVESGPGPEWHETTSDVLESVAYRVRAMKGDKP